MIGMNKYEQQSVKNKKDKRGKFLLWIGLPSNFNRSNTSDCRIHFPGHLCGDWRYCFGVRNRRNPIWFTIKETREGY